MSSRAVHARLFSPQKLPRIPPKTAPYSPKNARKAKKTEFLEKSSKKIWWNRQNALPLHTQKQKGSLAQLNRASDYGSEGCGFESLGSHLKIKELQRCNSFFFCLYDTNLIQILDFDVPFKCIETVSYLMKFHKILPYQPHLFAYRCLIFLSGEDKIPLLSNCCGNLA